MDLPLILLPYKMVRLGPQGQFLQDHHQYNIEHNYYHILLKTELLVYMLDLVEWMKKFVIHKMRLPHFPKNKIHNS